MALVEYAEAELRRAGWFDADSDYAGMIGPAVLQMVRQFAEEGHSGFSAGLTIHLFQKVASFRPLTPLDNPMKFGEFHDVNGPSGTEQNTTLQSTRRSSVFSEDSGKTWYDIDKKRTRWERFTRSRRAYIQFPYMPK